MEPKKKNFFMRHKIVTAILIFIVVAAAIDISNDPKPQDTATKEEKAEPTQKEEVVEKPLAVTADEIVREYKANEIAADAKFKGKQVEISGTIDTIGKDVLGDAYFSMRSGDGFNGVQCYLENEEDGLSLSSGQQIKATGEVSGWNILNVTIKKCTPKE